MAPDNAFINPFIDLQLSQSNTEEDAGYEALLLRRSVEGAESSLEDMKNNTASIIALESMADFIQNKKIDKTSAILFNIATEGYGNLSEIKESKTAFSMESFAEDNGYISDSGKEQAINNVNHNTAYLIDKLSQSIRNTLLSVGDMVHSFDRNMSHIKSRVSKLETLVADIENKDSLAFNYVKPEKQFIYLMYTDVGFKNGIKPVISDIKYLFSSHADMVEDTIGKYKSWYINHKNSMEDKTVFDTLTYDPKDFILKDSKIFTGAVGTRKASGDNVFYRTRELPGGLSFYTELHNRIDRKTKVIDIMTDIDYFLDDYKPESFRMTEKHLYTVATMSVLAWASVMMANPLPMALSGFAINTINEKTKTTDASRVRLNENNIFPVLNKQEIEETLNDLKELIKQLDSWNESVYKHSWKDNTVKQMFNELSDHIKNDGYSNNVKYFRNYAIGLISLMSKSYSKLHGYGFDVINAIISYAEKSARQYR